MSYSDWEYSNLMDAYGLALADMYEARNWARSFYQDREALIRALNVLIDRNRPRFLGRALAELPEHIRARVEIPGERPGIFSE